MYENNLGFRVHHPVFLLQIAVGRIAAQVVTNAIAHVISDIRRLARNLSPLRREKSSFGECRRPAAMIPTAV